VLSFVGRAFLTSSRRGGSRRTAGPARKSWAWSGRPTQDGLLSPPSQCSPSVLACTSQLVSSHAAGGSNHPWVQ
jgi:hypothetical protein